MIQVVGVRKYPIKTTNAKYYLPDSWHLRGIKNANEAVKSAKDFRHWCDLMYLQLRMNMREFEQKELPRMRESIAFVTPFLGSMGALGGMLTDFVGRYFDIPEKDPEMVEVENNCYDMWDELDSLTFTTEDQPIDMIPASGKPER